MPDVPFTYATHRRTHWLYYATLIVAAINVVIAIVFAVYSFSLTSNLPQGAVDGTFMTLGGALAVWSVISALATLEAFWLIRAYAVTVQDRVIRLEQTQRLQRLLPPEKHALIARLSVGHFVALRFASDGEIAELVEFAVSEPIPTKEQLKRRIQTWVRDDARI